MSYLFTAYCLALLVFTILIPYQCLNNKKPVRGMFVQTQGIGSKLVPPTLIVWNPELTASNIIKQLVDVIDNVMT